MFHPSISALDHKFKWPVNVLFVAAALWMRIMYAAHAIAQSAPNARLTFVPPQAAAGPCASAATQIIKMRAKSVLSCVFVRCVLSDLTHTMDDYFFCHLFCVFWVCRNKKNGRECALGRGVAQPQTHTVASVGLLHRLAPLQGRRPVPQYMSSPSPAVPRGTGVFSALTVKSARAATTE